jgi:hypothetical protein
LEPGEKWAYRKAPYNGPVSEVQVLKIGSQRPLRVKVRFLEEEAEGREEWVPPARLRVPWTQKDNWLENQRRWDELTSDGPDDESAEFLAASIVFDECPLEGVVWMGWNFRERGLLYIHDAPTLAAMLQVTEDSFRTDPRTLTDDQGTLTAPWPTTVAASRLIAKAHAEHLVNVLARKEERARQRAICSPERPVKVVAHSLGGVIAVDMATSDTPLWMERLVTFGSQAAFFHICDPRGGQLRAYVGDQVTLPASLGDWTNLWEPLDMLAFSASRVFRLHDGTAPADRPVAHAASTGLWTHGCYWDHPDIAAAIGTAMTKSL